MNVSTTQRSTQCNSTLVVYEIADLWQPANDYEAEASERFKELLIKFGMIDLANALLEVQFRPKSPCGFGHGFPKVKQVWGLIQSIRRHGFQPPPGDEIMVRAGWLQPHNGTHRAAILLALKIPAPAIVIDNWKTFTPIRHKGEPPW